MITHEEWAIEQLKPLSMFETAKWWADGLKVLGAGNGAGILTAGAALSTFNDQQQALLEVKLAGLSFFIGLCSFALAFFLIYFSMHSQDELSHAALKKDKDAILLNSSLSSSSMKRATQWAFVSAIAFVFGVVVGLIAFLSF